MFWWKSKTQRCIVLDSASRSYTNVPQRLDLQKVWFRMRFYISKTFFHIFSGHIFNMPFFHIFHIFHNFVKTCDKHVEKMHFENAFRKNMWKNVFWKSEKCEKMHLEILRGKMPGQSLSLDFFGSRAACCLADLCHKRFGDNCLGGLSGHGATGIWIGLKIGYHQNGY